MQMSSEASPSLARPALPGTRLTFWLVIGVLILNLVVAAIGAQSLRYSRERTVEQVRNTTTNLAELLENNLSESAQRIDLALLNIADALEHRMMMHPLAELDIERTLALHKERLPEVDAFRVSNTKVKFSGEKGSIAPPRLPMRIGLFLPNIVPNPARQ